MVETVGVGLLEGVQGSLEAVQVTSVRQELLRDEGQLEVKRGGEERLGVKWLGWLGVVGWRKLKFKVESSQLQSKIDVSVVLVKPN
jgi:hypothetical protein